MSDTRIYVCHESHDSVYAERLSDWRRTGVDQALYEQRERFAPDDPAADALRSALRAAIWDADVVVCILSQGTSRAAWINWELRQARSDGATTPLVGIELREPVRHPPAMVGVGAIFVPFRRDAIERAIQWAVTERHLSGDFSLLDD